MLHLKEYTTYLYFLIFSVKTIYLFQSDDSRTAGVSGLVGRVRGLRDDVQKKISRLRNESTAEQQRRADQAFPCSNSSIESLPSGSGSSKYKEHFTVRFATTHNIKSLRILISCGISKLIGLIVLAIYVHIFSRIRSD